MGPRFAGPRQGADEGGSAPFDPPDARAPAGHGAHADLDRPGGRFACERGRQVARIGGNLNHLGAVSGLVERRRRPHWDDLPSHLAGEKPRPAAGFVDTPRSQRRLMAFPLGIAGGERPPAEGGMGVHMPTLPDADRGIPKGGVAPFFGRKLRSGVAAPPAVPQL